MAGRMRKAAPTRRDAADAVRLKHAGSPAHINAEEARLLARLMPEAAGPVITEGLLAEAGRGRDDRVTLLTERERALLKRRGGSGAVNPATGLLEYDDSDDDGNTGNTSNAGENTGGMSGAPGSGVAGPEGPGTGRGDGPGPDGIGDAYSGPYGDYSGRSRSGISYGRFNQPAVESLLAAPNFAVPGLSFTQYAPRDTWGRALQEWMDPHPAAMRAAPGRLGVPNAHGPGIMGSVVSQLAGGPFSAMMGVGGALGRASSQASQAANARDEAARSAHNSGGNQGNHSVLDMDAAQAKAAGTASGARTAELPQAPPGYTINPAGQVVPMAGSERGNAAWKDPVQNLLYDYIWRGRVGSGFGW